MAHELPALPYAPDALAPVISAETIEYHYGKHHQAYVTNLNNLIPGTEFETASLEEIVMKSGGGIFNNASRSVFQENAPASHRARVLSAYTLAMFAGGAVGAPWIAPKQGAFVREALKKGLRLEPELGANPLKYGIIASTDTHLGTPGLVAEDRHVGHGGASRVLSPSVPPGLPDAIEFNPGGLAVVWAEENSRDAIFAALERREVYGTSGTRPTE